MAKIKNDRPITLQRLKEVLYYDATTGVFIWITTLSSKGPAGSVAGVVREGGYRIITLDREQYKASRLAWFYINGEFPPKLIDHINRIKTDDRIANLRLATPSENLRNTGPTKRSTSGLKGAYRTKWGWQSSIMTNGKLKRIGSFRTAEEASAAYVAEAKLLHGEFMSVDA
jgi:hypothetical protein